MYGPRIHHDFGPVGATGWVRVVHERYAGDRCCVSSQLRTG